MNPKNIKKVTQGKNPHDQFAAAAKAATPKPTPKTHEEATKYQGPHMNFRPGQHKKH